MATDVDEEASEEANDVTGFLPPIRRSCERAALRRDTDRPSMTSSKEVSVCDRAKLTCFVLCV